MIVFKANKNVLSIERGVEITSGSVGIDTCQFLFSPDWEGLSRTAVFYAGDVKKSAVLDSDNCCHIPWEVLETPLRQLYAGVYGTRDGTIVLPTTWVCLGEIQKGAIPGETSEEPTPGAYDQIASIARQLLEDAQAGRFDGATPHIGENDNWWVENVDTGHPSRGVAGPRGETPHIGENGNWWIGAEDTGKPSLGGADRILCDAAGNPVQIRDSSRQVIRGLAVFGKSTQSGTPSPNSPVAILSVGDAGNLTITASDDGANSAAASLSNNSHPDKPRFPLRGIPVTSGGNVTIAGQQYLADTLEVHADGSGQMVKRIAECIFDGNEQWIGYPIGDTVDTAYLIVPDSMAGHQLSLCTHFANVLRCWDNRSQRGVYSDHNIDKRKYFNLPAGVYTISDWKTYLSNQYQAQTPVCLCYVLDAPAVVPVSPEEVQSILALQTYKPITNVSNDGGAWLTVTYVADTKTYIDNKFAQLAAQLVANT